MSTDLHVEILLDRIFWPDPTDITENQIHDMAASLLNGQVEAIVVAPTEEAEKFRGVVGRLRYEGMKWRWRGEPQGKTILARVHTFKDDVELKIWQMIENLHRREITAMLRARQYKELYGLLRKEYGEKATIQTLTAAIEEGTGNPESAKTVQHYLSLTKLEPKTQEVLTSEKLSLRAGLELLRVEDPEKQVKAAEDVQKDPERYRTVEMVRYHVDAFVEDKRKDKQRGRLQKKAEELRKKGKIVLIEPPYGTASYNERQKYHTFYGQVPEKCNDCPKLGIMLSGNFQQKPMCADPKCYENMEKQKSMEQAKEQKEIEQKFDVERAKVYGTEPDVRHWRLAVFALMDTFDLQRILNVKISNYARREDLVWMALSKLDEKTCQGMLIRKAVEEILTGPQHWGRVDWSKHGP